MTNRDGKDGGSFRDACGFVFVRDGVVYRRVHKSYEPQYRRLMDSGLYDELVKQRLLTPHNEIADDLFARSENAAENFGGEFLLTLRPKKVPFISYPYEWCFGQFRAAALATLRIFLTALKHDMILKDATAYNIQFFNGAAVLIDTLSFDFYRDGEPWIAYGQFCRHFLAPLLLMAKVDFRLAKLTQNFIDGVPLDLAAKLLGFKGGFFGFQHINLHARAVARNSEVEKNSGAKIKISKSSLTALAQSLIIGVERLQLKNTITEWGDYYRHTNYSANAAADKAELIDAYFAALGKVRAVWDFGANDGTYSKIALKSGAAVTAFDFDYGAVERNFTEVAKTGEKMLPLVLDLTAPSPAIGFANRERQTLAERQHPDVIMMLAVIHHLAIANNLPLARIAEWVAGLTENLIIEFVPKEDSQTQILLKHRADVFPEYTQADFERIFSRYFRLTRQDPIKNSRRTLYLYARRLPESGA